MTERVSVVPRGVQANGDSNFGISPRPRSATTAVSSPSVRCLEPGQGRPQRADGRVRARPHRGHHRAVSADGGGDNPGIARTATSSRSRRSASTPTSPRHLPARSRTGTIERISVSHDGSEIFSPSEIPWSRPRRTGGRSSPSRRAPRIWSPTTAPTRRLRARSQRADADDRARQRLERRAAGGGVRRQQESRDHGRRPLRGLPVRRPELHRRCRRRRSSRTSSCVTARPARPCSRARTAPAARLPGRARTRRSAPRRFVAFASFASDLIAGVPDPDGALVRDAFVRDLAPASTEMISVNSAHQDATRDASTTTSEPGR